MNTLIIDNNIYPEYWGASDIRSCICDLNHSTVKVRRAPALDLPSSLRDIKNIIISGSVTSATESNDWTRALDLFIKNAIDKKIPILGICYGHQVLGRILGGKSNVRKSKQYELGWTKIEKKYESKLFLGLPSVFYSFSTHYDEVCSVPQGCRLTAQSQDCAIEAFESMKDPIFGIQFHPEKSLKEAKKTLLFHKKQNEIILNEKNGNSLFKLEIGRHIFNNFLKM